MSIREITRWTQGRADLHGVTGRKMIDQLHARMDRLWTEFLSSENTNSLARDFRSDRFSGPLIDVHENDREYRFEVELPGLTVQDVKVIVGSNVLTIKGERRPANQSSDDRALHLERSFGPFERSFALPFDIYQDKFDAGFDDGVLTIRVEKNLSTRLTKSQIKIRANRTAQRCAEKHLAK